MKRTKRKTGTPEDTKGTDGDTAGTVNSVVKLPVQRAVRISASHDGELFFRITFISFLIKISFIAIFVKTCF